MINLKDGINTLLSDLKYQEAYINCSYGEEKLNEQRRAAFIAGKVIAFNDAVKMLVGESMISDEQYEALKKYGQIKLEF